MKIGNRLLRHFCDFFVFSLIAWTFPVGTMLLGAGVVLSQTYPNKPIRIVTSPPGGGTDLLARTVAQGISGPLGQPVIVENRGSGVIPGIYVAKTTPDGYTLVVSSGVLWTGSMVQTLPYDPVRDFAPITLMMSSPNILVVRSDFPVNTVRELIAWAKARQGQLNYASAGTGGSAHLGAELFKSMAGIDVALIPYKGAGSALIALIGGEVQMMFAPATAAAAHVQSGKLKGLAVTSAAPSVLFPGVPTMAASGVPGIAVGIPVTQHPPHRSERA